LALNQLNYWLLKSDFKPIEKIEAVKAIYDKTGVSETTKILMRSYHDKALIALEKVAIPAAQKNVLTVFANEVMLRIK
jgi:geranylgeranyl pyrophosphate synthase